MDNIRVLSLCLILFEVAFNTYSLALACITAIITIAFQTTTAHSLQLDNGRTDSDYCTDFGRR